MGACNDQKPSWATIDAISEAALQTLKKNVYGKKFYHLGPKKDKDLIVGFEKQLTDIQSCDFILCTGFLDEEKTSLSYYKNLLKKISN